MPQLDIIIIFPQIFWFFFFFIIFYSILIHYILPKILLLLKSRKVIIIKNTEETLTRTEKAIKKNKLVTQFIINSLIVINATLKVNFINSNYIKNNIDFKISLATQQLILYYNKYTINLVTLYHKNFNYKK